jgi:hypothetical protein
VSDHDVRLGSTAAHAGSSTRGLRLCLRWPFVLGSGHGLAGKNTHLAVSRAARMDYFALPLRGRTRERKRDGETGFYHRAH